MTSSALIRWGGAAAALGGWLWIVGAVFTALKPEGCIGEACSLPGRSVRTDGPIDATLSLASVMLIALGAIAVFYRAREVGGLGTLGRMGQGLGMIGALLLVAAGLALSVSGAALPYAPLVVLPGGLAIVAGFLLVGAAIVRSGVLPFWTVLLLVVGAVAMLGHNDQDARALLAVPFGLAWIGVGYVLWPPDWQQR